MLELHPTIKYNFYNHKCGVSTENNKLIEKQPVYMLSFISSVIFVSKT